MGEGLATQTSAALELQNRSQEPSGDVFSPSSTLQQKVIVGQIWRPDTLDGGEALLASSQCSLPLVRIKAIRRRGQLTTWLRPKSSKFALPLPQRHPNDGAPLATRWMGWRIWA